MPGRKPNEKAGEWLKRITKDTVLPSCKYCGRCMLAGICCNQKAKEAGLMEKCPKCKKILLHCKCSENELKK